MPLCAVCRRKEASQDHHILYEPYEIKVGVCLQCHTDIHGSGTGPPQQPDRLKYKVKGVRGIPTEIWKMVKIRSTLAEMTMGEYISKALASYLEVT